MKSRISRTVCGAVVWILVLTSSASAQTQEAATLDAATSVLSEFMRIPNEGIPRSMLTKAQGIVVVPAMLKVGFVAGVRHGKGIAVIRDERGAWKPPTFVTMSGGSVGWQVGVQSTDVILVFNTRKSVNGLLSGKFTIGADATAAAGPLGRQVAAATDSRLQAEILSYSRARGLFVGAAVDGSVLQIDAAANQTFYRPAGFMEDGTPFVANAQFPPSAGRLLATLASYSGGAVAAPAGTDLTTTPGSYPGPSNGINPSAGNPAATFPAPPGNAPPDTTGVVDTTDPLEATRRELATAAEQLGRLLDDSWRRYLSLPKGVLSGEGVPSVESLEQSLMRFERVTRDSRYSVLLEREEFQQVYGLLRTYVEQVRKRSSEAALPSAGTGYRPGASATIR